MPGKLKILPFLLPVLAACSNGGGVYPAEETPKEIVRLDRISAADTTAADALHAWGEIIGRPLSAADYSAWEPVRIFGPVIDGSLPPLDSVERVLGHALAGADSLTLVGVISPYNQAVVTHPDGYVFIALNHYLGADSPVYAGRFPDYERRRKTLGRLPADVVQAIVASRYPADYADDATLLNHMIYEGALLRCVLDAMPAGTPEATVLAMTPDEYAWCEANEGRIWHSMIEQGLLYSSNPLEIRRMLAPAPSTGIISADAPGQTALYIALRIVGSYLSAHPSMMAAQMLASGLYNSNQTLIDSKYTPSNAAR